VACSSYDTPASADRRADEEHLMTTDDRNRATTAATLPHLLDIAAVAEHLGVTVRHVRRLVAEQRIPFIKWWHLIRFDPVELREWLDQARRSSASR
jgi:excisionase family DNA binding protein